MNKTRYFQWLDGEQRGSVTTLSNMYRVEDEVFLEFADGECCNIRYASPMTNDVGKLKDKFIVEIYDPTYAWEFETIESKKYKDETTNEVYDIPTLEDVIQASGNSCNIENTSLGKTKLKLKKECPYTRELPNIDEFGILEEPTSIKEIFGDESFVDGTKKTVEEPVVRTETSIAKHCDNQDPVYILANTCKKHPTDISINVCINLPNKSVFKMVSSEFENGADNFINYIVNDIDLSVFSNAIKQALFDSYNASEEKDKINTTDTTI